MCTHTHISEQTEMSDRNSDPTVMGSFQVFPNVNCEQHTCSYVEWNLSKDGHTHTYRLCDICGLIAVHTRNCLDVIFLFWSCCCCCWFASHSIRHYKMCSILMSKVPQMAFYIVHSFLIYLIFFSPFAPRSPVDRLEPKYFSSIILKYLDVCLSLPFGFLFLLLLRMNFAVPFKQKRKMKQKSNDKPKCAHPNSFTIYLELNGFTMILQHTRYNVAGCSVFHYVPDVLYIPFIKWKQMSFGAIIKRKIYMKNTQMHTALSYALI